MDFNSNSCSHSFRRPKIPELMRGLGRGVKEFKDGVADDESQDDSKE